MFYFIEDSDISFPVNERTIVLFLKNNNVIVKIKKVEQSVTKPCKVYLTRFSTLKQAEAFLAKKNEHISLLEEYDEIHFFVESLHVKEVSRIIPLLKLELTTLYYIPTVDRLLKTDDDSLIDLPTNIFFLYEGDNLLSIPANNEEITKLAAEARLQSNLLAQQAKKRFHRTMRTVRTVCNAVKNDVVKRISKPRRCYITTKEGKEVSDLIASNKTSGYLLDQRRKRLRLADLIGQANELQEEVMESIKKLKNYQRDITDLRKDFKPEDSMVSLKTISALTNYQRMLCDPE